MKFKFFVFSFILSIFALPAFAYAAYLASDLLGQLDDNDQPLYTKNGANNGPNNIGMSFPDGIVIDTVTHRLFVSEANNNRVVVYNLDSSNNLIDRLPDNVLGQPDFFTGAATVTAGGMNAPEGLAYDSIRNYLFVTDYNNNRVLVYDVASITDGENAINVLGQPDFNTNTAVTTQSGMIFPFRLAYDSVNTRLFVAENVNDRVLVYDVASITDGENAINVLGQPDFTSSANATTQSGLNFPAGLAYDSVNTRLFVLDNLNNRVLVFDVSSITDGENAINVLGQAFFNTSVAATTQSGLSGPTGMVYDSVNQRLFVSGRTNHRVTVFDVTAITDGENAINVLGQTNFTNNAAVTTQSGFFRPRDMAYDSGNQRLYVPEEGNNRVMIFDVASIVNGEGAVDLLGQLDASDQPVYTRLSANGGPNNIGFSTPKGVGLDSIHHRLFVADTVNNRILVYNLDSDNNLVDKVADNVLGQPDFNTNTAATTQGGMSTPLGLLYDSENNRLFVRDSANKRVLVYDVSIITNGMDASYVLGQTLFTTSATATTQNGMSTEGVGLDYDYTNNRLFIPDRGNNRVLVFDLSGGITNGMNASYVLGQAHFNSGGTASTQSGMNQPDGVAYDSIRDLLFVAEVTNDRVTVWDVDPDTIANGSNAVNVLGQVNFTNNGTATTQNGMSAPDVPVYDSVNKRLFVGDFTNRRVMIFDVASIVDGENAVAILGKDDYTSSTSLTTQSGLASNQGLTYDSGGNRLYLSDTNNNRIMIYDFVNLQSSTLSTANANRNYSETIPTDSSQGSVSLTLTSGTLPPGLSLSGSSIVGEPTTLGTYNFSLTATDDNGAIGTFTSQPQSYTITVEKAPSISGSRPSSSKVTTTPTSSTPIPTHTTTPQFTTSSSARTLKIKDIGEDVRELQKYLNTHGFPLAAIGLGSTGNETTKFGLLTHSAVIKLQIANKLTPDGIVGPMTRAVMK